MNCRFCNNEDLDSILDLKSQPPSNAFLKDPNVMEKTYPLHLKICKKCFLTQVDLHVKPEKIFSNYAYYSSQSAAWLKHCKRYAEQIKEAYDPKLVVEIASNDGYLLQYFKDRSILGIEPAQNIAREAESRGIPTVSKFFTRWLASQLVKMEYRPDLIVGNNVLAHVPDINDFVGGLKTLLHDRGIITMEFPHLAKLIEEVQFDTIYQEHFSYFTLDVVNKIFSHHGLQIFNVEELHTHGGSLRIYAQHAGIDNPHPVTDRFINILIRERYEGYSSRSLYPYKKFQADAHKVKRNILKTLIGIKDAGHTIAGIGAPAKANTLLNFCGIGSDIVDFVVDTTPYKQGRYLPGSHIPIYSSNMLDKVKPKYVWILPWNHKKEILARYNADNFLVYDPKVRGLSYAR